MARDLIFRQSRRDWSRESSLTNLPALSSALPENKLALGIAALKAADKSLRIRPSGTGVTATKTFRF